MFHSMITHLNQVETCFLYSFFILFYQCSSDAAMNDVKMYLEKRMGGDGVSPLYVIRGGLYNVFACSPHYPDPLKPPCPLPGLSV